MQTKLNWKYSKLIKLNFKDCKIRQNFKFKSFKIVQISKTVFNFNSLKLNTFIQKALRLHKFKLITFNLMRHSKLIR